MNEIKMPGVQIPMVDPKTGKVTIPWAEFFTRLSAKLNEPGLNFKFVAPDLIWTDPNGNPHVIASQI